MGGRAEREQQPLSERELWITEVSDARLSRYELMLRSAGAGHRIDGRQRVDNGAHFADLVRREIERRKVSLF